jgi:[protein-PII] uridylyltransferase
MRPPRGKPDAKRSDVAATLGELSEAGSLTGRERFLDLSRAFLSHQTKQLIDHRSKGTDGKTWVRAYTGVVDSVVRVCFERSAREHGVDPGDLELAMIGIGGYGREELVPYSDVDILVLCKRKTAVVKSVASAFVRLMWDVGFELGHAVESLMETESTLARHMDTRTALFESRRICGSAEIAREVEKQIGRLRRKDREAFLERKIRDVIVRHEKYSGSYQLIEPNIKLSPGGMRDFQTLVWLGMVLGGKTGLSALRRRGFLLPGEAASLEAAYDFLLKVRVELRLLADSKQDQLTLPMQQTIAATLSYQSTKKHLGVELFMRDYYNRTRTIFSIVDDVVEELQRGADVDALLRKGPARNDGKLSMGVSRGLIKQRPLYVFEKQKEAGRKLSRRLKRRLETVLREDLTDASTKRMRQVFPDLMRDGTHLTLMLRSMHETGFLGAMIPEYRDLTSLKRYDLYHHYTVDEHSFQVVHHIEMLAAAGARSFLPFSRLYSEIANKQILYCAALLHDIGKIEGKGHAKKGAVLARRILKRMGMKSEDIEGVAYLIEIHLLMSHFSQRRDPGDPETLRAFCKAVGNRSNLKYLCLLTYADLKATSPLVWTDWKRNLLWTFYLRAYRFMAQSEKRPDAHYQTRKQALLKAFGTESERERAAGHLDKLPGRYLLTMSAPQVRTHLKLVEALGDRAAIVSARRNRPGTEITFCTRDKPYRLSQLCGVLTLNDCNILFAHAFTRTDGIVLDVFHVEDVIGSGPIDDARVEKINQDLHAVLRGGVDIQGSVEKHMLKWKRKKVAGMDVPIEVKFENDISDQFTIIDIFAMDEPGLLFKLTRALAQEGLIIHRARISTEANRAIDSFDVQSGSGNKLTSVAKMKRVRVRLETAFHSPKTAL